MLVCFRLNFFLITCFIDGFFYINEMYILVVFNDLLSYLLRRYKQILLHSISFYNWYSQNDFFNKMNNNTWEWKIVSDRYVHVMQIRSLKTVLFYGLSLYKILFHFYNILLAIIRIALNAFKIMCLCVAWFIFTVIVFRCVFVQYIMIKDIICIIRPTGKDTTFYCPYFTWPIRE